MCWKTKKEHNKLPIIPPVYRKIGFDAETQIGVQLMNGNNNQTEPSQSMMRINQNLPKKYTIVHAPPSKFSTIKISWEKKAIADPEVITKHWTAKTKWRFPHTEVECTKKS